MNKKNVEEMMIDLDQITFEDIDHEVEESYEKKTKEKTGYNANYTKEATHETMRKYREGKSLQENASAKLLEYTGLSELPKTNLELILAKVSEENKENAKSAISEFKKGKELELKAKEEMCLSLEDFILWMVNTKFPTFLRYSEDLKHEGILGVLKGIDSYDPDRSRPTTFFFLYILHEMSEFINRYINKTTSHYSENIVKIKKVLNRYEHNGRKINVVEIAQETNISPETIIQSIRVMNASNEVHYDADYIDNETTTFGESPEDICLRGEENRVIFEVMNTILTEDERKVLILKNGLDGTEALSYKKIFETTGMPIEQIRKNYNRAIRKLRNNKLMTKTFKSHLKEQKVLNQGIVGVAPVEVGEALEDELLSIAI